MKRRDFLSIGASATLLSACASLTPKDTPPPPPQPPAPVIALALGGGASRGFVHIGVIKALETHKIVPDLIVGTSAGSVVGALYASGLSAFNLQEVAHKMDERTFQDWSLSDRGFLKGDAIETFVNREIKNQAFETLKRRFAAVATDLSTGEAKIFNSGNVGQAVRASCAVPGVFSPVSIAGREYVDGGLSSPVPVNAARQLGANYIIAVDISARPSGKIGGNTLSILLDTVAIMGNTIGTYELKSANAVIRPKIEKLSATNFTQRNEAILEGERAGFAAINDILKQLGRQA